MTSCMHLLTHLMTELNQKLTKSMPRRCFPWDVYIREIPTHNQKCWQSLNLVVYPQTDIEKDWGTVNLVVVSQVRLLRSVAVSCLRYLNKAI